ncbi:phage tail spike protein [Weissella fangxianensis]|uniref:phage tail spike protein n=1 Tax=Weissella fangxianensis TaxID=2953879 RepID=UPI00215721C7|nr:phage tail spike protein [Weissella fangxianensis]
MIPILYKSAEVDFTTNGLGLLNDIYSVDIQEQRNGLLTLTASYPTNAKHYKEIETGRIIYAKPNPLDNAQAFRIVKTELDISGYNLNIEADHITYDLTHNLVKEVHLQGDGQNAMTHLQNATVTPHLFKFTSDLQHIGDSRLQYVNPMEAIAGTEGSILQIWGGELHRDNRIISMLSRRGRDNFTTFRLGKNINGLKYTVDMSNVTTRIVPTVTKSDATDSDKAYFVVGDVVDSKNLNKYSNVYIQHVDMGEKVTINEGETDEQIKAKIDKQAKNWFTQSANTGIDLPQVTVEIDVTSLQDSADYQEKFRNLESVGLTDTVSVYVPEFNVNVTAIVNELHYDPVAERVTSLVVGTSKKSFADNNSNALAELQNSITQIRQDATTAIVSSNGKNTNYYSTKKPAHPVEGDLWFKQVGDETYLMIFKDGRWQEWVSTKTQEEIAKKVDDAIQKAKDYTDELNDKQSKEVQEFQSEANEALSEAAAERNSLSVQADTMLDGANSYADSMADSAAAYGKAQAGAVLSQAQTELATAKQQLGSEVSKAQSDITTTNKQLAGKVSQTDFDKTTGDLSTKYGQVKATADAVTTDVAKYKQTNDKKVSANIASIATMSDQITSKISKTDLDKATGELNSKFTQQQQTVDSISQTVTELQAKANSQGQVNQLLNTEFTPDLEGWSATNSDISYAGISKTVTVNGSNVLNITHSANTNWSSYRQQIKDFVAGDTLSASVYARATSTGWGFAIDSFSADGKRTIIQQVTVPTTNTLLKIENVTIPSDAKELYFSFWGNTAGTAVIYKPMLVFNSTVGDYVQGNYNNNSRVSALEVDLDGINGLVNDPKNGLSATAALAANGLSVATKAQNDAATAIQTAEGVQTKVEQMGSINQLVNTEFSPNLEGWNSSETSSGVKTPYRQYIYQGSNMLTFDARNQTDRKYSSIKQTIPFATSGSNRVVSLSWWSRIAEGTGLYGSTHIRSYDANMVKLTDVAQNWDSSSSMTLQKFENAAIPDEAQFVEVTFAVREGYLAFLTKPMLVFDKTVGTYVQGNYNNNNSLESTRTQLAGQIADEIKDRKSGDGSVVTQMTNLIDSRVKNVTSGYETAISQSADKVMASVSMPNQLINTEFTPDLEGWSGNSFISYVAVNKSTKKMGSNVLNITHSTDTGWGQYNQKISNFMAGGVVSASVYAREDSGNWAFTLDSYDVTGKRTILKSVNVTTGYTLLKIENVTIPSDAVELRYSFWCQTAGMLLIAQPMLVFSNTVPTYMPGSYSGINTSTVLELFKDNWALGIADNSGKIISGINGDTSGTVIQGKKLVINSDTTINGTAFIDGSVIKNASIGTAQIGKAAVGSAQIINVDVSKISGNIANFITANVNTLNARVLYGDTGHLGTTDTGLIINKQDNHLQLSSKGQYNVDTKRAQLELLNYADNIDSNMQGSLNYYKNPHNAGTGLGIRFYGNQILAIDEAVSTGNLYLSPYASGQVQVVNRDRNGFQDIKASKFVTSSERKYKSEINEFNDDALDLVNGLNIRSYIKNSENEIGVIADEADERILDKTNTGVDLYSFVSVVAKAVQELSEQVKELQDERPNN